MGLSLSDIPIVGDAVNMLRGNPDAIKAAYDAQIKAAGQQQQQLTNFLMGQKARAQAFYAPMQSMYNSLYGSQGMQGPMVPKVPGSVPYGGK